MRLVKVGGKVSFLVPPSMNNGAFFKCLRKRVLELGKINEIKLIRENDSFDDALTSVQILLLERTDLGYEKNKELSDHYIYETKNSLIFTDRKENIKNFARGKKTISDAGYTVKTGAVVWNQHKQDFVSAQTSEDEPDSTYVQRQDGQYEKVPADAVLVLFSKDISKDNAVKLSDKISAPSHWIRSDKVSPLSEPAIIVNRIVGSLDNPRLRFAYVEGYNFCGENHVNVITRSDHDASKIKALYDALKKIDAQELSDYLKAVTGNTQLSATELSELPVSV